MIMLHIYYIIGILVLISVISQLLRFNRIFKVSEWYEKFKKVTGKKPLKNEFRSDSDYYLITSLAPLLVFEGLWIIFGLITNNWFIFVLLFIYGKLVSLIFKNVKYTIIGKSILLHLLILKTSVYAFMIINHFHIGLDLFEIFKGFLPLL